MIQVTENECISFSDIVQLHELYYSKILDCQAKTCSIFTKRVSEKEVAVFGEYKILVLFRNSYVGEESSYAAVTVRKNICEIVSFEAPQGEETAAVLLLHPSCDFKYGNADHSHSYWEIHVHGEIRFSCKINKAAGFTDQIEVIEEQSADSSQQENIDDDLESHVWQFEENDDISIEQLMDMDLETLKNIGK